MKRHRKFCGRQEGRYIIARSRAARGAGSGMSTILVRKAIMINEPKEKRAYELRIQLDDIKPVIWRSVVVPSGITLDRLHDVIQIAMGWLDYHLHLFKIDGRRFSEAPTEDGFGFEDDDEALVRLNEVLKNEKAKFSYVYDFGDDWRHTVTLTRIIDIPDGHVMRMQCLDGKRDRKSVV